MADNYFSRRWHGRVPTPVLLWRDMLVIGTLLNLLSSASGLLLVAQGMHAGYALALHFAPLPYNVFLFAALTRQPCGPTTTLLAYGWFIAMLVL